MRLKWRIYKNKVKLRTKKYFRLRALIKCQKIQAMLRFLKTSATSPYKSVSADTVLDDRLYHKQEKKLSQHYYKSFTKCVIILQQHFHHQNNLFWKKNIFGVKIKIQLTCYQINHFCMRRLRDMSSVDFDYDVFFTNSGSIRSSTWTNGLYRNRSVTG